MRSIFWRANGTWSGGRRLTNPSLPANPPTPDSRSYWSQARPVGGGWDLDPARGKRTGLHPGATLSAAVTSPLTINTATTYQYADFRNRVTVNASGVTFISCRFTALGFDPATQTPGTDYYAVIGGTTITNVTFIDCEFYGGRATTVSCAGTYVRCHFYGGNDLFAVGSFPEPQQLIECTLTGVIPSDSGSHADSLQFYTPTTNTTITANIQRSWIVSHDEFAITGTTYGNACIQFGTYVSGTAGAGMILNNYFDGGGYALNTGSQQATAPTVVNFQGNRFGRGSRWGVISNRTGSGISFDSSNVWADTLEAV